MRSNAHRYRDTKHASCTVSVFFIYMREERWGRGERERDTITLYTLLDHTRPYVLSSNGCGAMVL